MEKYKLGELPEPLGAWAKFRPENMLDFSRRAKNLAAVLELPLQKTQHALACAFGYSGLHELKQVLQHDGMPGPFDDVIPAEIHEQVDEPIAIIQFYRHARLLAAINQLIAEVPKRYFDDRDTTVCDLDLFSTAVRHRTSAKALMKFLGSEESGSTFDGFPYGYRGALHDRYFRETRGRIDEDSMKSLIAGWTEKHPHERRPIDPRLQARQQRLYRAPMLFTGMAERTASDALALGRGVSLLDIDIWGEEDSIARLLLSDVDSYLAWELADGEDDDDAEIERLVDALRTPTKAAIAASAVASRLPDFVDMVPRWRLSLRHQWANMLIEVRQEYTSISDGEPERTLLLSSFVRDNMYETVSTPENPTRWLSVCMERESIDLDQQRWRVTATLLIEESVEAPWKAVALLAGDHIVATNDGSYAGHDEVQLYHDDIGHAKLMTVWNLLSTIYIPVAGFLSYHEWVNHLWEGGGVVACLDPWVSPAYRGSEVSRWLLEGYTRSFDDGWGYCDDSDWESRLDPRFDMMDDLADESESIVGPGVMFISLPGSRVLGYSVRDDEHDEPTTKFLRLNGERTGLRTRWGRSQPVKGGIGPRMMDVARNVDADIVLFDPDDPGADE